MNRVIVINGPLGSGKSTTARILKSLIPHSVILEPDHIRQHSFRNMSLRRAIPRVLKETANRTKHSYQMKRTVIIPYPFSSADYRHFKHTLGTIPLTAITLSPQEALIKNGRGKRKLSTWEKRRMHTHYRIRLHRPSFGHIVDNSELSARMTALRIQTVLSR